MPTHTSTIFVSCVTDEFKSYRDEVVKWLDRPRVRIETQERFIALGETTLVKLDAYIRACDAVVHLVGDRTGNKETNGVASAAAVSGLLHVHPLLPKVLGFTEDDLSNLSYTQWEAWLAVFHRRKLFVAVPDSTAVRDATLNDAAKVGQPTDSLS